MLTRNEIEMLCVRGESVNVDFKREQYKFYDAPPHDKSELLKDIISMANSGHAGPSYILIGVSEQPDKSGKIVGICQGDVNSSIKRLIELSHLLLMSLRRAWKTGM